jgi:hypothetical protein
VNAGVRNNKVTNRVRNNGEAALNNNGICTNLIWW